MTHKYDHDCNCDDCLAERNRQRDWKPAMADNHLPRFGERAMTDTKKQFRYYADYETSTCFCPCGASFKWSGFDPDLDKWQAKHAEHAPDGSVPDHVVTEDGMRAYAKPVSPGSGDW